MNVRVKICGITCLEDALNAIDAGADALGFVFCEGSPRRVSPERAAGIIEALPPFVSKVGLFVNADESEVSAAVQQSGVDTVQFHGDEAPEFCRRFRLKIVKAFRVRDASSLAALPRYDVSAWLLDSFVPGKSGGTGERFNWDLARQATRLGGRIILAGGLTPGNVSAAVSQVCPYAVDVSSGVEGTPGRKEAHKMKDFIQAAKQAGVGLLPLKVAGAEAAIAGG
ncbi:MAG: phosphoribosylanthranilate isomerase [Verrucomicrobiota bacterium]